MKVLFIPPPQGYSEELLFYGLTELLGTDAVDFPRYDWLRNEPQTGGLYTALSGLLFGQAEPDRTDMSRRVDAGEFDVLVVSNRSWQVVPSRWFRQMPTVFVDGIDQAHVVFQTEVNAIRPMLYFKREAYVTDGLIRPMPFSFPAVLSSPPTPNRPRQVAAIFGNAHFPRCRVLRAFEDYPDVQLVDEDHRWSDIAYRQLLQLAKCSLDVRGFGYGCLRRFESPAQGCILVGQRLPIVVPHDWVDGEDAYWFDDTRDAARFVSDLTEGAYLDMAEQSWQRYLKHHTTKARAKQFLDDVTFKLSKERSACTS